MVRKLLLFIWQLPQNLLGLVVLLFVHKHGCRTYNSNIRVYNWTLDSGISLGDFRFTPWDASRDMVLHEIGHSYQSLYLGPLYLIVIGLPSFIWATLHTYTPLRKYNYYSFYTEKWANKITGAYK